MSCLRSRMVTRVHRIFNECEKTAQTRTAVLRAAPGVDCTYSRRFSHNGYRDNIYYIILYIYITQTGWDRCTYWDRDPGGRGDELRLPGVVIRSPGTDQTLATGGRQPTSVNRHRSRVVGHSPDEVQHHSSAACSHDWRPSLWHGGRCAPCHCEGLQSWLQAQRGRCCPQYSSIEMSAVKILKGGFLSQA